jgi:RHS repeat-associated protein
VDYPTGTDKNLTYTDSGLVDTVENGAGTVDIDYDEFNRVTGVDGILGGTPDADDITLSWNSSRSELASISRNSYSQSFAYDALKRLSTITDDGSKVTSYKYNLITGTLKNIELPNGARADYSYDNLDRILSLVNQTNQGQVLDSYAYHYNSQGLRDKVTYANGNYAAFTYDAIGQLTDEHYKTAQGDSLLQLTYTYDKAGNRLTKVYDNDDTNHKEEYTVNLYNQVTAVSGNRGKFINVTGLVDDADLDSVTVKNLTPEPDKGAVSVDIVGDFFVGRKVELQSGTNSLQATATDKAGNETTYPSSGSHTVTLELAVDEEYEYDVRGNMILKRVDDVVVARYFYNYDNLIEYVWYASGEHDNEHPHYIYDGLGRRIMVEYGTVTLDQYNKVTGFSENTTKQYVFAGTEPIIEYDYDSGEDESSVAKQYYWGMGLPGGIGGLLYMMVPGSPDAYYYYHYDGSGNVTCVTDEDKSIEALYEYDAFGNIITACGSFANDFQFSTQMANTNAGWHMYMFRSYDPRLGRWTQRDPMRSPDSPNLYLYGRNSPTNYGDLLGLLDLYNHPVAIDLGDGQWYLPVSRARVKDDSPWMDSTGTKEGMEELTKEGASAAFGETGGIYPQLKPGASNVYNPSDWDPGSAQELQEARAWIADVRERNKITGFLDKSRTTNAVERTIWTKCYEAAEKAARKNLPSDVRHFFLRQEGEGRQKPDWARNMTPYKTFGPFKNIGGGDVPTGDKTFIDFYKGVR